MRASQGIPARREALNLRIQPQVRELIHRAAELAGKNRTDFVLEAARRAARSTLLDRTLFTVSPMAYRQFLSLLDASCRSPNQRLLEELANPRSVGIALPFSAPSLRSARSIDSRDFDSGRPSLDDWLRRRARANQAAVQPGPTWSVRTARWSPITPSPRALSHRRAVPANSAATCRIRSPSSSWRGWRWTAGIRGAAWASHVPRRRHAGSSCGLQHRYPRHRGAGHLPASAKILSRARLQPMPR